MCFLTVLGAPSVLCSADFPLVTLPFPRSGAKQGVGNCMGIPTGPGSQRPMNRMVRIGDTHPDSCDCAVTLDLGSWTVCQDGRTGGAGRAHIEK